MRFKAILLVGIMLLACGCASQVDSEGARETPTVVANTPREDSRESEMPDAAPGFTLEDLDGRQVFSDYRGRVVVLDFMATWCGPCNEEIGELKEVDEQFDDVVILSISNEQADTLREFKREKGFEWTVLRDPGMAAFREYGARAIPTIVVVNPEGEIAYKHVGGPILEAGDISEQIRAAKIERN